MITSNAAPFAPTMPAPATVACTHAGCTFSTMVTPTGNHGVIMYTHTMQHLAWAPTVTGGFHTAN